MARTKFVTSALILLIYGLASPASAGKNPREVTKSTGTAHCKGDVWISNGNGAPKDNCAQGKMCCYTAIVYSPDKGDLLGNAARPNTPPTDPTFRQAAIPGPTGGCGGTSWISNGKGFPETNCAEGEICCDTPVFVAGNGTLVSPRDLDRWKGSNTLRVVSSGCKGGVVWLSNGNGYPEVNCAQGQLCCDTALPYDPGKGALVGNPPRGRWSTAIPPSDPIN